MRIQSERPVICPCCETTNDYKKWYLISNEELLTCPACEYQIEYKEVSDQLNGYFAYEI